MKKIYLFITLLAVACTLKSQTLQLSIGGLHTTSQFNSVKYDASDGSTIHAGYIYDSTNSYNRDWFMVKLDRDQNIIWKKVLNNNGDDFIYKLIICANGDYVAVGEYSNNSIHRGLVCRINSATGNIKWSKLTNNTLTGEIFVDVFETQNKNIVISGTDQWASGSANSLIMLLSSGGKTKWSKISTYTNTDEPFTINQLPNGNLIAGITKWTGRHNLVVVELKEANGNIISETSHSIDTTLSTGEVLNSVWPWGIHVVKGEVTFYAQAFNGCCGSTLQCIYKYDTLTKNLSGNIYYHNGASASSGYAYKPLAKNDYLIAQSFSNPKKVFVSRIRNGKIIYDNLLNDSASLISAIDTTGVNAVFSGAAITAAHANAFDMFASRNNFASTCGITNSKTLLLIPSSLPATTISDVSFVDGGVMESIDLSNRNANAAISTVCGICSTAENLRTTNITSSTAVLRWAANSDPDYWQVQYKLANTDLWTSVSLTGSSRFLKLSGLRSNKKYEWRIRAKCNGEWAKLSENQYFTTLSVAFQNAIAEKLSVVSLQPNPSTGKFTVQYNSAVTGSITLKVYNQLGKEIFNQSTTAVKGENLYNINLPFAASGLYYLEFAANEGKTRIKLVIEK